MLTLRDLNRTLLARQHLLRRSTMSAAAMVAHLVGLQAQHTLPPYLALAARIDGFDPGELSGRLERGELVRLLTMRGTIHLHTADDASALRAWVQPALDRAGRSNQQNKPARHLPVADVVAATRAVLADGPLPVPQLGERLAERFPGVPAGALAQVARERVPLAQLPPRGLWRRSGGVVYQTVENHLGRADADPDVEGLVRRYLRAFGPATASDMTRWSRVSRLAPVFTSMLRRGELVEVACEDRRTRYDVPGTPYVDGDAEAPARLLGVYDNLWLSHADRSLVMSEDARRRWQGPNGGVASTVFVDGFLAGLWWWRDDAVALDLFGDVTPGRRRELDDEVERVTVLLRG